MNEKKKASKPNGDASNGNEEEKKNGDQNKNYQDEPLFIDPNNKAYLERDPVNMSDEEKSSAS